MASYRNYGSIREKGIELSVESPITRSTRVFVNYSYQTQPVATGFDSSLLNKPPSNRFNAGAYTAEDRLNVRDESIDKKDFIADYHDGNPEWAGLSKNSGTWLVVSVTGAAPLGRGRPMGRLLPRRQLPRGWT